MKAAPERRRASPVIKRISVGRGVPGSGTADSVEGMETRGVADGEAVFAGAAVGVAVGVDVGFAVGEDVGVEVGLIV